ncbi:tape measure protein [Gemmatimonas sp.]|uniref:tape measure protein n=1 Tax=Gemmatimonas sp. TaxID=1962908 RepID=UPI003564D2E9
MTEKILIEYEITGDGSEARVAARLQQTFSGAVSDVGPDLFKSIQNAMKSVNAKDLGFDDVLNDSARASGRLSGALGDVASKLRTVDQATASAAGAFGKAFDPTALAQYSASLKNIIVEQQKLQNLSTDPGIQAAAGLRIKAAQSELVAVRTLAQQTTLATRESSQNQSRDARLASKAIENEKNRSASAGIVATQTAAARELAIIRSASREQVATTQATARGRVAAFEFAARAIRSSERVISSTLRATADVGSAAFASLRRSASSVSTNISQSFRSSNSSISNSYSSTFRNASNTVNNETRVQNTAISNFARNATSSLGQVGNSVDNLGGKMGGLSAKTTVLAGLLGAGLAKALTGGFRRATVLENSERALTKLTGSAETAKNLLTQVTEVVTGTPFRLDQFSAAATQLLAFNIEADKIPEILRTIGDASALSLDPDQTVDRLVRTFGQISAAGKLTTEDLNQLTEAGVPAFALLGNSINKTIPEVRELVTKGLIPSGQAIDSLLDGIQNGTQGVNGATVAFAGLSKELGTTLSGSLANLNTAFSRAGANIIKAFSPALVGAAQTGTAAIDLIGRAFTALATAVVASPVFRLIQEGISQLAPVLTQAKTTLAPVFKFIAEGIVNLATAFGALKALQFIPGLFSLIGVAVGRILAPFNLLIAAGILVGGFIQRLIDGSSELKSSLSALGTSLQFAFGPILRVIPAALETLAGVIDDVIQPVVRSLAETVADFLVPKIRTLTSFIFTTVSPILLGFATLIRDDVVPAIGRFLGRAVDLATETFNNLVDFVRGTVIPIVGSFLVTAVAKVTAVFKELYRLVDDNIVPLLRADLIPALAATAAAIGFLALGNLPLAGLAIGIGAAVTALRNEGIREKIVEVFNGAVEDVKELFGDIFTTDTLAEVGAGALKAARKIGQVLGNIVTDPRLVAALAGIAASAAAVGVAFIVGLVEGAVSNVDELTAGLVGLLDEALSAALKALASNPAIAVALAAALFGAKALAKLVGSARQTGRVLAQALTEGAVSAGNVGVGGGAKGFVGGLFGGPDAIRAQGAQAGQRFSEGLVSGIRNQARVIQGLGGSLGDAPLALTRAPGEAFVDYNKRLAGTFQNLSGEVTRLEGNLGQAAVSGVRFRDGLTQISTGNVKQGFQQIGTAVKSSGREIATGAGAVAGGAFMASFAATALLEAKGTGDVIQGALGLATAGAGVFAATGNAPLAVASVAIGGIAAVFQKSKQRADELKASVRLLGEALLGLSPPETEEVIDNAVLERFKAASEEVQQTIVDLRIDYLKFSEAAAQGKGVEFIAQQFEALGPAGQRFADALLAGEITLGRIDDAISGNQLVDGIGVANLKDEIVAAGFSVDDFERTFGLLGETAKVVDGGIDSAALTTELLGVSLSTTNTRAQGLSDQFAATALTADAAAAGTTAFKDKLDELKGARVDELRDSVNEAKSALDEAKGAADQALQALQDFFRGGADDSIAVATDKAIIGVSNLSRALSEDVANAAGVGADELQAKLNTGIRAVSDEASTVLAQGIKDGTITDAATAATQLQPLVDAAFAAGGEGGALAVTELQRIIGEFSLPEGTNLLEGAIDLNALIADAQAEVKAANTKLELGLGIDPTKNVEFVEEAKAAAALASAEVVAEYAGGIGANQAVADQAAAALSVAAGKAAGGPTAVAGFNSSGKNVAQGAADGIDSRSSIVAVESSARRLARAANRAFDSTLQMESPSRVMMQSGEWFAEGVAEGITDGERSVIDAAVDLARVAVRGLTAAGEESARAIGRGFAENGSSFISSVGSAMDAAYTAALSKVDQFKLIGNQIGINMFGKQGVLAGAVDGGGSLQAALQLAFLKVADIPGGFGAKLAETVKRTTEFFAGTDKDGKLNTKRLGQADVQAAGRAFGSTLDAGSSIGRENRAAFLEAGLGIRQYAETLLAAGRPLSNVIGETSAWRDQLINSAVSAGANADQVNELINILGLSTVQLSDWAGEVARATEAVKLATSAEEARLAAAELARVRAEAAEEAEKVAEKAKRDAEDARREEERNRPDEPDEVDPVLPPPIFRDLILNVPTGDPEAIALATANRVAFAVGR